MCVCYKVKRNTAAIMKNEIGNKKFNVRRGPQKKEGNWSLKKLKNHWHGKRKVPEPTPQDWDRTLGILL